MPNTNVPAADAGLPNYCVDLLIADVANLHELIGMALMFFAEISVDSANRQRQRRVDALLIVAENLAHQIVERAERDISPLRAEVDGRA